MSHALERHRFRNGTLGWRCVTCTKTWVREPRSHCPGVPTFYSWDAALAAGHRTATQWRKEHRKVKPDAVPTAAKDRGPTHPNEWYDLYSEDQTEPTRSK